MACGIPIEAILAQGMNARFIHPQTGMTATQGFRLVSETATAAPTRLCQQNYQFHLGVENLGWGVDGKVTRAQHRVPNLAGLLDGEILVAGV